MASRPSKFDFWERFRSGPGQWRVQQALEVWLLKRVLIRALATWRAKFDFWWEFQSEPGQRDLASMPATFDFWILLVRISIRAWTTWDGQHACNVWLLVRISIRALSTWPGQQAFKVWLLVRISITAWTTWPGQHACKIWLSTVYRR